MLDWSPPIRLLHHFTNCQIADWFTLSTTTSGTATLVLCNAFSDIHSHLNPHPVFLLSVSPYPPFMTAAHSVFFSLSPPLLLSLIDNCVNIFWVKSDWSSVFILPLLIDPPHSIPPWTAQSDTVVIVLSLSASYQPVPFCLFVFLYPTISPFTHLYCATDAAFIEILLFCLFHCCCCLPLRGTV